MLWKCLWLLITWQPALLQELPAANDVEPGSPLNATLTGELPPGVNQSQFLVALAPFQGQLSGSTSPILSTFVLRDGIVVQELTALDCESAGCNCCLRTLLDGQHHLDWLDNDRSSRYCSPNALATKTHVFVLSSGIDETLPIFNNRMVDRQDCSNAAAETPLRWTATGVDKHGLGTMLANLIVGEQSGVTSSAVLHSIKVTDDNNEDGGSPAYLGCGLQRVKDWMDANPTQIAIVLVGVPISSPDVVNELQNRLGMSRNAVLIATTKSSSCFNFANDVPRVLSPGVTDSTLLYQSGDICANVLAASAGVNASTMNSGDSGFDEFGAGAVVAGVLAQYAAENPAVDAIQLADRILKQDSSGPLVTVGSVQGILPAHAAVSNKLISYLCPGGCKPCPNGGVCVAVNGSPTSRCYQATADGLRSQGGDAAC